MNQYSHSFCSLEDTWLKSLTLSKRRDSLRSRICEAGEHLDKYSWITHLSTAVVGMLIKNIINFRRAPHSQNFQIRSSCLFFAKQRHHLFKCLVVIYNLKITLSTSPFYSCLSPKPMLLTKDSQSRKKKKIFFLM